LTIRCGGDVRGNMPGELVRNNLTQEFESVRSGSVEMVRGHRDMKNSGRGCSKLYSWRGSDYRNATVSNLKELGWIGEEEDGRAVLASFDTAPSPHRRINAPSLLLAFAHIQGEAGTPTGGFGSAVVGRNSPVLCAGGVGFPCNTIAMTPIHTRLIRHRPVSAQANQCT
jgi:hypothetical protein